MSSRSIFIKVALVSILVFTMIVTTNAGDKSMTNAIRKAANEYFHHLQNMEFEKSLDYLYTLIFDRVNKDEIINNMAKSLQDNNIQIKIKSIDVKSISDITTDGTMEYALVDYSISIDVHINSNSAKSENLLLNAMNSDNANKQMKQKGYYSIYKRFKMFALRSPTAAGWRFLEFDSIFYKNYVDTYIPADIIKQFTSDKKNGQTKYYKVGTQKINK